MEQDHPCVIEIIRRDYLRDPSPRRVDYNLSHPDVVDPSAGQSGLVLKRLKNKTNGFFVECGGDDGEFLSNTLYMERYLNWSGLLIEAMNDSYEKLVSRNRKSYTLPVCISLEPYPTQVLFNGTTRSGGKIVTGNNSRSISSILVNTRKVFKKQCFPFYSILLAVGRTSIDFLSLDVEGHELEVSIT